MKLVLEVETKEDALQAQKLLTAYLGDVDIGLGQAIVNEVTKQTSTKKAASKKVTKADPDAEPKVQEEVTDESTITKAELTQIAKDAMNRTDKATAKDAISKYADRISNVDESDYEALAKDLKAL